jgi:hypothetical protein
MSTTIKKTIKIGPGETFVLPSGASIVTLITSGDGAAESECDLPDETPRKCWSFKWEGDSSKAFEEFIIEGVSYELNPPNLLDQISHNALAQSIAVNPELAILVGVPTFSDQCGDSAGSTYIIILAIPGETSVPEIKIVDNTSTGPAYIYLHGVEDDACDSCNNLL